MPLEVWDVAEPPRRDLMPRTGRESGIPAVHWKYLPCGHPGSLVRARSEYLGGEEVRGELVRPVCTVPVTLGAAMIPPHCPWGSLQMCPFGSIPSSRAVPPVFKIWVQRATQPKTSSTAGWHWGLSPRRPAAPLLGKAAHPCRCRSAALV